MADYWPDDNFNLPFTTSSTKVETPTPPSLEERKVKALEDIARHLQGIDVAVTRMEMDTFRTLLRRG